PRSDEAWSTNHDIWRVPVTGGEAENLTAGNMAADTYPRFSPDGKQLAFRRQAKPGYEADQWELVVTDANGKNPRSLTGALDRSVDAFVWAPDGKSLYFVAEDHAQAPI